MIQSGFFSNPQTEYFSTNTGTEFEQQVSQVNNLADKKDEINNTVGEYNDLYGDLMSDDPKYIDFSGNYLAFSDSKSSVQDAIKEDIHVTIMQRNNTYVVGMITVATVLITTYLVLKK